MNRERAKECKICEKGATVKVEYLEGMEVYSDGGVINKRPLSYNEIHLCEEHKDLVPDPHVLSNDPFYRQ